jgi:hypothetical protein
MKTNDHRLRFDDVRYAKRGGQPGNRNALKTGAYTAPMRAWRAWGRDWRKRVRAALAQAEAELRDRQHLSLPPPRVAGLGRAAGRKAPFPG